MPLTPNIEGKWAMIRAELSGEQAPREVAEKTELELKDGTYTVRFASEIMDRGTYELGSANRHATMILKGESGPNTGRVIPCLYQQVGNRLRVCYGLDGAAPEMFTSSGKRYLAIYRRDHDGA